MIPMRFVIAVCLGLLTLTAVHAEDPCFKSCASQVDCGPGAICTSGACEAKTKYCSNERWSVNDRGESTDCKGYICDENSGTCLRQASSSQHCTPGYAYNGQNACIPSISCDMNDPVCQKLMAQWQMTRSEYEKQTPEPAPKLFTCSACENHSQCGSGKMCWMKKCTRDSNYCAVDVNGVASSFNKQGLIENCGNFQCDRVSGSCLKNCLDNSDCLSGKTCTAGICL